MTGEDFLLDLFVDNNGTLIVIGTSHSQNIPIGSDCVQCYPPEEKFGWNLVIFKLALENDERGGGSGGGVSLP